MELIRTRINGNTHPSTPRPYLKLTSLKTLHSVVEGKLLSEHIVHNDIEAYNQKRLKTISAITFSIGLQSLKSTFNSAVKWELVNENPFRKRFLLKVPQRAPNYLTKENFKKLTRAVKEPLLRDVFCSQC